MKIHGREIEDKPYYVNMTDTFLSGWGHAKNKKNKLLIGCDTYKEAETVAENAKHRGDQKHINICSNRPRFSNNHVVSYHDKTDYGSWFKKDYFKKDNQ